MVWLPVAELIDSRHKMGNAICEWHPCSRRSGSSQNEAPDRTQQGVAGSPPRQTELGSRSGSGQLHHPHISRNTDEGTSLNDWKPGRIGWAMNPFLIRILYVLGSAWIDRFRRDNLSFLRTFDWATRNPRSSRTAAMKADAPLDLGFVNCGFEIHEQVSVDRAWRRCSGARRCR
jgi:hypothetical protein